MDITYERKVGHCEKSNYIKLVTIKSVDPAQNSDALDVIKFEESGWQAVVRRDMYNVGDKVTFIPPESILPFELSEALGVTNYLSKGRVKVARLRKNRSEGLVADTEIVEPYLDYILQWEDVPSIEMAGKLMKRAETPFEFQKFYKIPNLLNEPFTFSIGEVVYYSEKTHGTNCRLGNLKNPATEQYQLYVGTHETVRQEDESDLYWYAVKRALDDKELPKDVVFYGEIYGCSIQGSFNYGYDEPTQKELIIFAAMVNGEYQSPEYVKQLCNKYGLPCVKFYEDAFNNVEQFREIADSPSEMWEGHIREGIVLVSKENPNRMAKVIGFPYLEQKKRKERH